jgi:hypothetical protein
VGVGAAAVGRADGAGFELPLHLVDERRARSTSAGSRDVRDAPLM